MYLPCNKVKKYSFLLYIEFYTGYKLKLLLPYLSIGNKLYFCKSGQNICAFFVANKIFVNIFKLNLKYKIDMFHF